MFWTRKKALGTIGGQHLTRKKKLRRLWKPTSWLQNRSCLWQIWLHRKLWNHCELEMHLWCQTRVLVRRQADKLTILEVLKNYIRHKLLILVKYRTKFEVLTLKLWLCSKIWQKKCSQEAIIESVDKFNLFDYSED